MTQRIEKHQIKKSHPMYEDFAKWSFDTAKLRNRVLFICNCAYFGVAQDKKEELAKIPEYVDLISEKGYIDRFKLTNRMVKLNEPSYRAILKAQTAQQVIKETYSEFKSFARALHAKKLRNDKTRIHSPKYKKDEGYTVTFTNQCSSIKNGEICYSRGKKFSRIKTKCKNFQQVKIVPRANGDFLVLVVYNKECVPRVNGKYTFGIDLGIKNLMTITSDKTDFESKIVNGRPLDSLNQYLNVRLAYMQSRLPKGIYTSEAITNMWRKHNNQVEDYLHKASKLVIDLAIANDVGRIVIGYNKEWKKNMKKRKQLRKKTRMRFGKIPYLKLIDMIKYKAEDAGIEVVTIRESHTSKCSALDLEPICHHEKYMGKRSPRGRYTTAKGIRLNSDINGSLNILRLILGNDFINRLDKGCVLQPLRLIASNSRTSIK